MSKVVSCLKVYIKTIKCHERDWNPHPDDLTTRTWVQCTQVENLFHDFVLCVLLQRSYSPSLDSVRCPFGLWANTVTTRRSSQPTHEGASQLFLSYSSCSSSIVFVPSWSKYIMLSFWTFKKVLILWYMRPIVKWLNHCEKEWSDVSLNDIGSQSFD